MWSYAFTASVGIVEDSYQRIAVSVPLQDFKGSFLLLVRLLKRDLHHIVINITGREDKKCFLELPNIIADLHENVLPESKLFFTFIINEIPEDILLSDFLQFFADADIILVSYQQNKEKTVGIFNLICDETKSENSIFNIGVHGVPNHEIQWMMENTLNPIRLVSFHRLHPPNLSVRYVEFVHTRQCNTMITIDETTLQNLDYMEKYEPSYNQLPAVILTKCLLQLGVLVTFSIKLDELLLLESILPLSHPFTYRNESLAPSIIKRLQISQEDLQEICDISEINEAESDSLWMEYAISREPKRILSNYLKEFKM